MDVKSVPNLFIVDKPGECKVSTADNQSAFLLPKKENRFGMKYARMKVFSPDKRVIILGNAMALIVGIGKKPVIHTCVHQNHDVGCP